MSILVKKDQYLQQKTGFKNTDLEKSMTAIDFFNTILLDPEQEALQEKFSKDFFKEIYLELKRISETAIAPHSNALYASIFVYQNTTGEFFVHAASNMDPYEKKNLKVSKFRNCAEKQAALSAFEKDRLENSKLKIVFLFRRDNKIKKLTAEKLVTCKDCYQNYLLSAKNNAGVFVIVSEEMQAEGFLSDGSKPIAQCDFADGFRFMFFNSKQIAKLNLEQGLGLSH